MMTPLYHLSRARWYMLHWMNDQAERAIDAGLLVTEEASSEILFFASASMDVLLSQSRRAVFSRRVSLGTEVGFPTLEECPSTGFMREQHHTMAAFARNL